MLKTAFIVVLCLFLFNTAFAQKKDTTVYYLTNSGQRVADKSNADYYLYILPPDSSVSKDLFIVKGYYPNGKQRFTCFSATSALPLKPQGELTEYYPNGNKSKVTNFNQGETVGNTTDYYPNGKVYTMVNNVDSGKMLLLQCNDSTGVVLAEHGNGKWINFGDDFKTIVEQGQVYNGKKSGEWITKKADTLDLIEDYKDGLVVGSVGVDERTGEKTYLMVEKNPQFAGGLDAFYKFLGKNIRYPVTARRKNIQGRVVISFVVEADGTLSDFSVLRSVGDGIDEEAMRVIKLSPKWLPGMKNGKAVRVKYAVPISFTMTNDDR